MKVRALLELLKQDGWKINRVRGSHRQLKHLHRSGAVTVAGKHKRRSSTWYIKCHSETGWAKMNHMKYLVIVEESENSFGAYVPGLPGCIAAAKTREELDKLIQEAIEFHIEGLKAENVPVPMPTSQVAFVEVAA